MIVDNKKAQKRKRGLSSTDLNVYYESYVEGFKQWLQRLGYAQSSIKSNTRKLAYFFSHLQRLQIQDIYTIESTHIHSYYKILMRLSLSRTYVTSCLLAIKNFSKYTQNTENYVIGFDPVSIEGEISNEREIITQQQIQELFNAVNENMPIGMRDMAMLHLLYSCGLRSEEVARVRIKDIDYHKQLLYVQPGKTRKGRYVPVHDKAIKALQNYERYARALINPNGHYFLVNHLNKGFTTRIVRRSLNRVLQNTTITKTITPHCLRHSIATHLLQQGMQIEYIQQFLGHKTLQTTQLYIRMTHELL